MDISFFLHLETTATDYTSESSSMDLAVLLVGVFSIGEEEQQAIRETFFQNANEFGAAVFHMAYDVGIPTTVQQGWPVSESLDIEDLSVEREANYGGRATLLRNPATSEEVIVVETMVELSQSVPLPNLTTGDMAIIAADMLAMVFAQTVLEVMFVRYFGIRMDVKFSGFGEDGNPTFSFAPASSDEEE
jgi:hypothetical protein